MPFIDKLQEAAARYVVEIAIAVVSLGLIAIADFLIPERVLRVIGEVATGRIVVGLTMVLVFTWAVLIYIYFRRRLRFDKRVGAYFDKNGICYCSKCLVDRRRRMPMMERESGWWCYTCKQAYGNPDYKAPANPAGEHGTSRRGPWVTGWRDDPY